MRCLFCGAEIDEAKEIHPEDLFSKRKHAAEMSAWEQVTVTVTDRGGQLTVFTAHLCPNEKIKPGDVYVAKKEES